LSVFIQRSKEGNREREREMKRKREAMNIGYAVDRRTNTETYRVMTIALVLENVQIFF
jgi:hypothetical protein